MSEHMDRIMHHKYLGEEGFNNWILDLRAVIEEDGYEENEFQIYTDLWHPYYTKAIPPREAWYSIFQNERQLK